MSQYIAELTDATFNAEITGSQVPYLVDFWAPWCGPCRMVAPIVEELAQEYSGKLKVGKINVDDNSEVAALFGIASIPTLLIFKDGLLADRIVGALPRNMLKQTVDKYL